MKTFFKQKIGSLLTGFLIDYLDKDPFGRIESLLRVATFMDTRNKHSQSVMISLYNR